LALAGASSAARLPIRTFTVDDGLASDEVRRIRRDRSGFLWVLTREGLARFDGRRFTVLGESAGLPAGLAVDLLETRGGELFVTMPDGVYRLDPAPRGAPLRFQRLS
jgi:ligand-binding sensor domain-containing protein